jgi:hypothetical protein
MFAQIDPSVIGNDYLVIGTVEKKARRENMTRPKIPSEMMPHIHDFKDIEEIRVTQAGWFRADQEPPVRIPSPSTEWVKAGTKH